jgi:hypothetical protein
MRCVPRLMSKHDGLFKYIIIALFFAEVCCCTGWALCMYVAVIALRSLLKSRIAICSSYVMYEEKWRLFSIFKENDITFLDRLFLLK